MSLRNKKQDTGTAAFAGAESVLETKIKEIEKISNPIDQLFLYKALKESPAVKYDKNKVFFGGTYSKDPLKLRLEERLATGFNYGFWGGAIAGTLLAVTSVLSGGSAALVAVAFLAGCTLIGSQISKRRAQSAYDNHSAEEKHATKMFEMSRGIDNAIEQLTKTFKDVTGNFKKKNNMEILAQSSRLEEIKATFPEIKDEFNRRTAIVSAQTAFLAQTLQSPATTARAAQLHIVR